MQAIESQNLILYQTDLRGQWPEARARAFAARLPYARRLALRSESHAARSSLAGMALALRALSQLLGRLVLPSEIVRAQGEKPRLAPRASRGAARGVHDAAADFSISHAGRWVACAALVQARVGFDLEMGCDQRVSDWVLREAALKASGEGLRALREVQDLTLHEGILCWRGESWHARRLEGFADASACVVCSREVPAVARHALALDELFLS
jgi:phosphopantetheinyl transferase